MKINKKSETRMELRDYNWTFLLLGGFGLLFFIANVLLYLAGYGGLSLLYLGLSAIIGLVSLFLLAVASRLEVNLDKEGNEFSFSQKKLLGSWAKNYRLDEITGLKLEKTRSGSSIWRAHTLRFSFKKGAELPITLAFMRDSRKMDTQIKAQAEKIAEFLGIKLEIAGY
jgi:hypothetical protein